MELLLNSLKGQVNTLSLLSLLVFFAVALHALKRRALALTLLGLACLVFLLASTAYLPYYLVGQLESQYLPFERTDYSDSSKQVVIHVLGGGYDYDRRLPELALLSAVSVGRLAEGLRISERIKNSRLVFSGSRVSGSESMAKVMKGAATSLGVKPSKIELLEGARTTEEEAEALVRRYGSDVNLILVTDAVHMPRAMRLFRAEGLNPKAAPTNYQVRENDDPYQFKWVPSANNIVMMDRMLREFLGTVKAKFSSQSH